MEPVTNYQAPKSNFAVPIAIVLAGVFIAIAIFFSNGSDNSKIVPDTNKQAEAGLNMVREISKDDHIRGNPNAKIIVIEYSDTECPFCSRFHETMKKVMDVYGKTGDVAWVYRHFPLDQLHPRARTEAIATECVNEIGGADKFWAFIDSLYGKKLASQVQIQVDLVKLATEQGIDSAKFSACLSSGKYDQKVQDDVENAAQTGGNGTPWSVVVTADGQMTSINGAYPYENVKQIIDSLLAK
jgi:protein-disulfide isomerase